MIIYSSVITRVCIRNYKSWFLKFPWFVALPFLNHLPYIIFDHRVHDWTYKKTSNSCVKCNASTISIYLHLSVIRKKAWRSCWVDLKQTPKDMMWCDVNNGSNWVGLRIEAACMCESKGTAWHGTTKLKRACEWIIDLNLGKSCKRNFCGRFCNNVFGQALESLRLEICFMLRLSTILIIASIEKNAVIYISNHFTFWDKEHPGKWSKRDGVYVLFAL